MAKKPKKPKPTELVVDESELQRAEARIAAAARKEVARETMPDVSPYLAYIGKRGVDRITGFAGVVASISFDLFGCVQAVLSPPVDKEGKITDGRWLDINRILIADMARVMPVPSYAQKPAEHEYGPADKPAPRC